MSHYSNGQKNPPWMRNSLAQQQQQQLHHQQGQPAVLQSVSLTPTSMGQTNLGQVAGQLQFAPGLTGQVHLTQPLTLNAAQVNQQLVPHAYGQVQINQSQLANLPVQHQQQPATQYYAPTVSIHQPLGLPAGPVLQPPTVVLPTSISTSIAPPGIAIPTNVSASLAGPPQAYNTGRNNGSTSHASGLQATKQRVFTGTVTKLHDCFGFVDEDVFFHTSCVKGTIPQVGDRVLVEASLHNNMPFKWNATRIQLIGAPAAQQGRPNNINSTLSSRRNEGSSAEWSTTRDNNFSRAAKELERSTPKNRETDWRRERKSRSPSRQLSRSRSPSRKRSRSHSRSPRPSRYRQRTPKYSVQVPKFSLDVGSVNIIDLRRRYSHMYIPSDFVKARSLWIDSFPANLPLSLDSSVSFHIFDKDVDSPIKNDALYDAPDADYSYSAKVMLLSLPPLEEMFRKCCSTAEDADDIDDLMHPARMIKFLIGIRGKNETTAIGGPWSPSLDGANPQSDPQVLIRTAIRTCKALTGIDLTSCTQWYRFAEIRYLRASVSSSTSSASAKSRFETVVMFVPDVWSCLPTATEWQALRESYINPPSEQANASAVDDTENDMEAKTDDENVEDCEMVETKKEPTHFSLLDPKNMKIGELRAELEVRSLNTKGLRSQLTARLGKALKAESETEKSKENDTSASGEAAEAVMEENSSLKLPATPHLLVHPSRTAKGGKFDCALVSLSVLLDYRLEDSKEHTFEVSLFSELFNEMLMRDFGILIYHILQKEVEKKNVKKEKKSDDENEDRASHKANFSKDKLLLAFSYFDLTRANYISEKDLEELLLTLGLQLSRSQVRKLLQKVVPKEGLRYVKLVNQLNDLDDTDQSSFQNDFTLSETRPADSENRVEEDNSKTNGGFVNINGCLVDVNRLVQQLQRLEKSRVANNSKILALENQLEGTRTHLNGAENTIKNLQRELADEKQQLSSAQQLVVDLKNDKATFLKALEGIHKTTGVLLAKETEEHPERPPENGETGSREKIGSSTAE